MKLFVITPGQCHNGFDPDLSPDGKIQIVRLRELISRKTPQPPMIVIGLGNRFRQTYNVLLPLLANIPIISCPICGTGAIFEKDGTVTVAARLNIIISNFMGINGTTKGFWPWDYFGHLENGSLLIADGELMRSFGFQSEPAGLYELETKSHTMVTAHHKTLIAA